MPHWLLSIPAFIVAVGLLVAVHEYGHFWAARRLGVKVLRYSIGFGSKLWSRTSRKTGTEYRISAVPLGGYVKMLDEREGPVPEEEQRYAFNRQSVGKRMLIVAAGPAVNFAFAVLAYWLVFMIGIAGIKPMIGAVPPDTRAAAAGLSQGDQILAVESHETPTWQELRLTLLEQALDRQPVRLTVLEQDGNTHSTMLDLTSVAADPEKLFKQLGLTPYQPEGTPVIVKTQAGRAAARAGLQAGDRVLSVNGERISDPQALVDWVQDHPGQNVAFKLRRGDETLTQTVPLAAIEQDGRRIGRLGALIGLDSEAWDAMRTEQRLGPIAALPAAAGQTWSVSVLTVRLLGRMVVGQVSWRNISGPIQIADYAGKTASIGLTAFLGFMALISISLGVINLLPVPVLDGGHLLYYALEFIRGRPLPEGVQVMGQQIGMAALLLLMSLAFYNDILRLLG